MRAGVSHLIYSLSLAKVELSSEEQLYFVKVLQENFKHPTLEIQEEATKAFRAFQEAYLATPDQLASPTGTEILKIVAAMFKPSMQDENIAITRGYNMAFGVLSKGFAEELGLELVEVICKNCVPKGNNADEAETRKFAVRSLIALIKRKGL